MTPMRYGFGLSMKPDGRALFRWQTAHNEAAEALDAAHELATATWRADHPQAAEALDTAQALDNQFLDELLKVNEELEP